MLKFFEADKIKARLNILQDKIKRHQKMLEEHEEEKMNVIQYDTCDNCGGVFLKNHLIEQDNPNVKYYCESIFGGTLRQCSEEEYKEAKEKDEEVKREFKRQLFCKNCNQN